MSLFVQVTVVPTATVTGLGEYAVVVMPNAPLTIDTEAVGPDGVGVGAGVGAGLGEGAGDELLLQAATHRPASRITPNLIDMSACGCKDAAPLRPRDLPPFLRWSRAGAFENLGRFQDW